MQEVLANGRKKLILRYLSTPKEFLVDEGGRKVKGVVF
jgi:hypothetical protein